MRKFLLAIMAAALGATAAPAAPTEPAPEAVIKLEPWRSRWVMKAEIGGKERKFLLDTAGGLTLISPETAKAAGCELYGRVTGFNMFANRGDFPRCAGLPMKAGGIALMPHTLSVIDMGALNPKDAELDGLVALNLFDGRTVSFDFAAGVITIESEASRADRIAGMTPLPIKMSREVSGLALAVLAEVPTDKGPLLMELDSGNGGTILVSKAVANLVGMDPDIEGKQRADFTVVGDIRATSDDAFTPDLILEGNLGMPFLRNWILTLDLARGQAWLGKPPVPPGPALPLPPQPK